MHEINGERRHSAKRAAKTSSVLADACNRYCSRCTNCCQLSMTITIKDKRQRRYNMQGPEIDQCVRAGVLSLADITERVIFHNE